MTIRVEAFQSNSSIGLENIIKELGIGTTEDGTCVVRLITCDQDINVDCSSIIHTNDYEGSLIELTPIIDEILSVDELNPFTLTPYYLEHPDYFRIELLIKDVVGVVPAVVQLKNEFIINFIPNDKFFNLDCLKKVDIN